MRLTILLILTLLLPLVSATGAEQEPQFGLRLIVVETEVEAADLRAQIEAGASFGELAQEHSVDPSSVAGGYVGTIVAGDLREEFQYALSGLSPGELSPIARVGDEYVLLLLLTAQESRWIEQIGAGVQAFQQGRYAEAEPFLVAAVEEAEAFGPQDSRLAESLNSLAELYRLQGNYAEAEPLYQRSLTIAEQALGPDHPNVGTSLNNLAALYSDQGNYAEAEPLYQRSLTIREQALGPDHPDVAETLEGFAALLRQTGRSAEADQMETRAQSIRSRND